MDKVNKFKGKSKTLKKLKEEIENYFSNKKYNEALNSAFIIIKMYPKNIYGYVSKIKAATNNYEKYLKDEDIKELKQTFDNVTKLANKNEKIILKRNFEDYIDDCHEVENLSRIKKELTGKYFLKKISNNKVSLINHNINLANTYSNNGKRIKNIFDFIKGIFLLSCLIFNLIHTSYLLILTIPFGVFGFITIYSFIDMNFFKKGKIRSERENFKEMIESSLKNIQYLKLEILKLEENIDFLTTQKNNVLSKIPEVFRNQISSLIIDDENKIAMNINEEINYNEDFIDNNMLLNIKEINSKMKMELKDDDVSKFITTKLSEKKSNQNKAMNMKKIRMSDIVILFITLLISMFCIVILVNNFYEINFYSFIIAIITGIISMAIYNINTGRHKSLTDTFNDNLLSTIFNTTLVYDLIYESITNELRFTYGFIQMPIIFILIFIGFIRLISFLKYNYLLKNLRR